MRNKVQQALILCGGKGQRLKPITEKIPKPLVNIGEEPILSHQIKYLFSNGIKKIVIATGYKSSLIEQFLSNNFNNLDIRVVNSGDVDIISRIKDCKKYLDKIFLICYGDTLADINIEKLNKFHNSHKAAVSVCSYQMESQFGILISDHKNRVLEFLEKPKLDAWINIGYFIFENTVEIKENSFVDLIKKLVTTKNIFCYKHKGLHITVNTITELNDAEKNIKEFYSR